MANSIQKSGLTVAGCSSSPKWIVAVPQSGGSPRICLYEFIRTIHCDLYLSQGRILCKAHAKSSNHRWDNATFYPCFCHEISHTITNAHIKKTRIL